MPLLLLIAVVAFYSAAIMALNSVVLPEVGINGFAQLPASRLAAIGIPVDTGAGNQAESNRDHPHTWGASRYFSLWLRPFGVHREGMNDVWWGLGSFAVVGSVGSIILFLVPKRIRYVSQVLRDEPLRNHLLNLLLGMLAYAVSYALLRLSWLTIVGVPFIPFLVGGLWLATMVGIVAVSFALGRALAQVFHVRLPALARALVGLWVLFVTTMLPVFGWLIGGAAAALGLGLFLQTRFGTRQRWTLDVLEDVAFPPEPQPRSDKILPLRRVR